MKTIIDKNTGQELFATTIAVDLNENEIAVDEVRIDFMVKPYFNFETRIFYETATAEEIEKYNNDNFIE
jgi:hypothetical protein